METAKRIVLAVDDQAEVLTVIDEILGELYDVRLARSAEAAMRAVNADMPAIILLDIAMPGQSGFDLLAQLRASGPTQNVPVLFITSNEDAQTVVSARKAGAQGYIVKPFTADILCEKVADLLK